MPVVLSHSSSGRSGSGKDKRREEGRDWMTWQRVRVVQPKKGTAPMAVSSEAVTIPTPPVDTMLLAVAGIWS